MTETKKKTEYLCEVDNKNRKYDEWLSQDLIDNYRTFGWTVTKKGPVR